MTHNNQPLLGFHFIIASYHPVSLFLLLVLVSPLYLRTVSPITAKMCALALRSSTASVYRTSTASSQGQCSLLDILFHISSDILSDKCIAFACALDKTVGLGAEGLVLLAAIHKDGDVNMVFLKCHGGDHSKYSNSLACFCHPSVPPLQEQTWAGHPEMTFRKAQLDDPYAPLSYVKGHQRMISFHAMCRFYWNTATDVPGWLRSMACSIPGSVMIASDAEAAYLGTANAINAEDSMTRWSYVQMAICLSEMHHHYHQQCKRLVFEMHHQHHQQR